jgi:hypothetical protein
MTAPTKIAGVVSGAALALGLFAAAPAGATAAEVSTHVGIAAEQVRLPAGTTVAMVRTPAGTAMAQLDLPAGVSLSDLRLELDCDLTSTTVTAATTVSNAVPNVSAGAETDGLNTSISIDDLLSGDGGGEVSVDGSGDDICSAAEIEASGIDGIAVEAIVDLTAIPGEAEGSASAAGTGVEAGTQVTAGTPSSAGAGVTAGTGTTTSGAATARVGSASGGTTAGTTATASNPVSSSGTEVLGVQVDAPGALARTGAGLGGLTLAAGAFLGGGRLLGLARRLLGG